MVSQKAARKEDFVFGAYNGHVFCGLYDMDLMTEDFRLLTNARKLKRQHEGALSQQNISTSTGFAPDGYEYKVANFGKMDSERIDPADKWPKAVKSQFAAYGNERLLYGPRDPSHTHPENEPYIETVKERRITAWNTERIYPLDPMTGALLQYPIQRKAGSTDANRKFSRKRMGPFVIQQKIGKLAYELDLLQSFKILKRHMWGVEAIVRM
ncbi:BRCT domain-containing protein [Lasiodiplodia theobromae]|uniref:BRCT domain-containing protein n=1 Tax=Lasiodiplodia theobromae TaxID=45133 RepID=UPI0015C2D7AE|nr:BRCT domain-containing protein [Lasiodiplodia theobromae]KAF4536230.1 BRCT domain-containing protein [Lasiodiplodia theobromae]